MSEPKPKLVSARWVAPYVAQLLDGTVLVPQESVVEIPEGEAKESDNWAPVKAKKAAD